MAILIFNIMFLFKLKIDKKQQHRERWAWDIEGKREYLY